MPNPNPKRDRIWLLWSEFNRYSAPTVYTTKQAARDAATALSQQQAGVVVYIMEAIEFAYTDNTTQINPTT